MAFLPWFRPAILNGLLSSLMLGGLVLPVLSQEEAQAQDSSTSTATSTVPADAANPIFKSTVRRVVVDVVVTDPEGNPVRGLTKDNFTLAEDGEMQKILSFEPNGFGEGMDYMPPKLPPEPPNTFVNLPATPEKGPLYVLLYDLVNMDNEDQMSLDANQHEDQVRGRQQLMKFIQSKPEGSRFCIFVRSDELHLIQGFTSSKAELAAAVDPHSPRPHIPEVYLMGENVGRADAHSAIVILNQLASYLDGLPGRKNLIWFSGTFPLSLTPSKDDGPNYTDQIETTLNLMARNQIAIYPVDVRGVVLNDWHSNNGMEEDGPIVSDRNKGAPTAGVSQGTQSAAVGSAATGKGQSLAAGSYMDMDQIARLTGGRAFYSNNDVSAELIAATQNGQSYYTLTYAPTNRNYDGKLRSIRVALDKKGYRLAYRRNYFGSDPDKPSAPVVEQAAAATPVPERRSDDTLDVNMKHGAPIMHQLIFAAHVHPVGTPAKGTAEQMAQLARQPAYMKANGKVAKSLSPIPLQKYAIDYTVMTHQLHLQGANTPMNLELAAAAYDTDGKILNAVVDDAKADAKADPKAEAPKVYRMQQEIDAPLAATTIRIAIHDANTGRVGAMEIKLPLAPESQSASAADGAAKPNGQTN